MPEATDSVHTTDSLHTSTVQLVSLARRSDLLGEELIETLAIRTIVASPVNVDVERAARAALRDGGEARARELTAVRAKLQPLRNGVLTWFDALREGSFAGYGGGVGLEVTEAIIDELVESVNASEQPVPIDGAQVSGVHEMPDDSGAPAAGFVLEARKLSDAQGRAHLWLKAVVQPRVADKILADELLYGSVAYYEVDVDPESGRVMARLHSYALTNKPFIPGLTPHSIRPEPGVDRPIAASVRRAERKPPAMTEAEMKAAARVAALRDLMGDDAKDKSDDEVEEMWKAKGKRKEAEEAPAPVAAATPPAPAPVAPAHVVAADDTAARLAKLESEIRMRDARDAVRTLLADKRVRVEEILFETLVELQHAGRVDRVRGLVEAEAKRVPPSGEALPGAPRSPTPSGTFDEALKTITAEIKAADPSLSRVELAKRANRELAKRRPDLVNT